MLISWDQIPLAFSAFPNFFILHTPVYSYVLPFDMVCWKKLSEMPCIFIVLLICEVVDVMGCIWFVFRIT